MTPLLSILMRHDHDAVPTSEASETSGLQQQIGVIHRPTMSNMRIRLQEPAQMEHGELTPGQEFNEPPPECSS